MTFAAPLFAWVAGAIALATVALHLLAWRRPPPSPLPTARFAPERPVRLVSRAVRPTDLPLLALRVVLVLLVGLALARPTFARERRGAARVVVVDRSRSAGGGTAVIDSARLALRSGDALVVFDSAAREISALALDSLAAADSATARSTTQGSISAALVSAVRAANRLKRERELVEIVLVSPVTTDETDAATAAIRRMWAGPLRVVRPSVPLGDSLPWERPDARAPAGDPVAATLALVGSIRGGSRVRVVRDSPTAADSAWAGAGGTLVAWPVADRPNAGQPAGVSRGEAPDSALSVTASAGAGQRGSAPAGAATVVARLARLAAPPPGRVIARWGDGTPAAADASLGSGCLRTVAIAVPAVGDLALTPSFRRFAERMVEPCAGAPMLTAAPDRLLATVLPPAGSAEPDASRPRPDVAPDSSRLTAWLLGLALVAALAEMLVRRGDSHAAA